MSVDVKDGWGVKSYKPKVEIEDTRWTPLKSGSSSDSFIQDTCVHGLSILVGFS